MEDLASLREQFSKIKTVDDFVTLVNALLSGTNEKIKKLEKQVAVLDQALRCAMEDLNLYRAYLLQVAEELMGKEE